MNKLWMCATALALLLTASASRTFALSGPAAQSAPATQAMKDATPPVLGTTLLTSLALSRFAFLRSLSFTAKPP